jgi:hypothetical protein
LKVSRIQIKVIIFETILTSIEAAFFEAAGTVAKIGLSLKLNHRVQI